MAAQGRRFATGADMGDAGWQAKIGWVEEWVHVSPLVTVEPGISGGSRPNDYLLDDIYDIVPRSPKC